MKQQQQQQIDLSSAEEYTCTECNHNHFTVRYLIKKLSALVSPTGEQMLIPIQAFACTKCAHINSDFIPEPETLT